ncbi:MAG TPA: tol-pal system protein YbgF [Rhizomicrobium sp.]
MRDRVRVPNFKSLSFAASLMLGTPLVLMAPAIVHDRAHAGTFDKDENINADSRRLSKDLADPGHPNPGLRIAGVFGPSDEEKAAEEAARQRENAQDANIQSLNQRVQDLENTVRRLTGQNEALGHKVDELRTSIDRTQKDFEYRLCTMSAQQLGETDPNNGGLNCGATGGQQGSMQPSNYTAPAPSPQRYGSAGDTTQQLAPPPGSLGTLSSNDVSGPPRYATPATDTPRQLASIDTNSEYNSAMTLLARQRYDEARSAFRGFADSHPEDPQTPQAVYWVGDIAYVQKDYPGAARAFAEQIKKYPQSTRAPDSMLKLGQSLIAMGQKQEGCTTLGALKAKYPQAPDAILTTARDDRKASCH